MAEAKGNTAVPQGDHDRVAMLSLKPDGTPDQTAKVEIIGNKDFALEAAKEQFKQQAVSAVDAAKRAELIPPAGSTESVEQDPAIAELKAEHDKVAEAAEKAAESAVGALFTEPAADDAKSSTAKK